MMAKRLLSFRNSSSDNFEKNLAQAEKLQNLDEGGEEAYRARAGRKRYSVQLDKKITQQLLNFDRRSSTVSTGTIDSLCESAGRIRGRVEWVWGLWSPARVSVYVCVCLFCSVSCFCFVWSFVF